MEDNRYRIDGYDVEDIKLCLGNKTEYYMDAFSKIERRENTFNYAAALVSGSWLAYRMMWKAVFIHWAVVSAASVVLGFGFGLLAAFSTIEVEKIQLLASFIIIVGDYVVMGYLGNHLYWNKVKSMLDKQECRNRQEDLPEVRKAILLEESKPSIGAIFVAAIILNILDYLLQKFVLGAAAVFFTAL